MEQNALYADIRKLLFEEKIEYVGCIPFSEATVYLPRLAPENIRSVVLFLIPYDTGKKFSDGVSVYAHVPDYHSYFSALQKKLISKLTEQYPEYRFYGFADHSPILEKEACAKAGLGVIGKNTLLINERYGSYVFIGSIFTDAVLPAETFEIKSCLSCGKCMKGCPGNAINENGFCAENCLSMLSQKKSLTPEEADLLAKHGVAWGCDRCQENCPMNREREFTPIPFFREHIHGTFSSKEIEQMDDAVFTKFAFSWRGRKRITENLQNLEERE